jgi:hypothetical protein
MDNELTGGIAFLLLIGAIVLTSALLISHFIGRKRQIGFGWSLFLSLFLTPVVGLVVMLLSKKSEEPAPLPMILIRVLGWIVIAYFVYYARYLADGYDLVICIGFIGLGIYMDTIGKGGRFDVKNTNID